MVSWYVSVAVVERLEEELLGFFVAVRGVWVAGCEEVMLVLVLDPAILGSFDCTLD